MCYRTSNVAALQDLKERYLATFQQPENFTPYYHLSAFARPRLNVLTTASPGLFIPYEWGLIPPWEKSMGSAAKRRLNCANARGEELAEKPSYRDAWSRGQRCLIPVTGFFESHTLAAGNRKAESIPYFIRVKKDAIFSLGGLYNDWADPETGEVHRTFTILTVQANSLMAKIHNSKGRMPLILARGDETAWLDPKLALDVARAKITPFPSGELLAHTVSKDLHNPKANLNTESALTPVVYEHLNGMIP